MKFVVYSNNAPEKPLAILKSGTVFMLTILLCGLCAASGLYAYKVAATMPRVSAPVMTQVIDDTSVRELEKHLNDSRKLLVRQKEALEDTRRFTGEHLNAMGAKLGLLQAQVMRLNALGERLTDISGLDDGEFNFDDIPGLGGARESLEDSEDNPNNDLDNIDLVRMLDGLDDQIVRNEQELSVLEALILDRKLDSALHPDSWPMLGGWISSKFGSRRDPFSGSREFHSGIDIANKPGAEIKAVASGVVSFAGKKPLLGFSVDIKHGNNYVTRYSHASELLVSAGERVEKGQAIAIVGSTGRSTGLHLHFEVHKDNKRVDPLKYLSAASQSAGQ